MMTGLSHNTCRSAVFRDHSFTEEQEEDCSTTAQNVAHANKTYSAGLNLGVFD